MDAGVVWTVIGVVVTVVFGVFAVAGYFRDHPRRQLEYTVRATRLVSNRSIQDLDVFVKGIRIPDPHLVEFRLKSNSRADIPSSAFDAARNLSIRVEPGGALVLGEEGARGAIMTNGGSGEGFDRAEFTIGPQLIRRGDSLELDFMSSGRPTIKIDSPLIDVGVVDVTRRPSRQDSAWIVGVAAFATVMFILLTVAPPLVQGSNFDPNIGYWFSVGTSSFMLAIAGLACYITMRWRR